MTLNPVSFCLETNYHFLSSFHNVIQMINRQQNTI